MTGLINFSQAQYENLKKNQDIKSIEKCLAVDIYSNEMDSSFAKYMSSKTGRDLPPGGVTVDYFSADSIQKRIVPYFIRLNFTPKEATELTKVCKKTVKEEMGKLDTSNLGRSGQ